MYLRSVELQMPDRAEAVAFLKAPWGLIEVGTNSRTTFLRGTGPHHYSTAISQGPEKALLSATFVGSHEEVEGVYGRVRESGLRHGAWVNAFDEPGNGAGFHVSGLEGEPFRFIVEAEPAPEALPTDKTHPLGVAHVVFNTRDREAATDVMTKVFGFKLTDRTGFMNFIRCNELHHMVAYAESKLNTLNHIAFEMKDTDAVLRGMGRLKDAGWGTVWGPGRHGPGDNVFAYFVGPFGACIEYTAEIQRVDDSYVPGSPESWKFPAGRNDQWGVFSRDMDAMAASSDTFPFSPIDA